MENVTLDYFVVVGVDLLCICQGRNEKYIITMLQYCIACRNSFAFKNYAERKFFLQSD